jgi:hypothetical protein
MSYTTTATCSRNSTNLADSADSNKIVVIIDKVSEILAPNQAISSFLIAVRPRKGSLRVDLSY